MTLQSDKLSSLALWPAMPLALAFQRHLLFPATRRNAVMDARRHTLVEVSLPLPGGGKIDGYLASPDANPGKAVRGLIYFSGRREHPTSIFRCLDALPDHHVLCLRYPGLGLSLKKPGEAELVDACLAAFDGFARLTGLDAGNIAVAGRSLGSGLAVPVAAQIRPSHLILISPFDRLITAVRQAFPPISERWLKDRFDNRAALASVTCPCLLIIGDADRTIPATASRRLFEGWDGPLSVMVAGDAGHRGLLKRPDVQQAIGAFLRAGDCEISHI
jgi:pimeloyl-ACP methyl ester carboxylesterase